MAIIATDVAFSEAFSLAAPAMATATITPVPASVAPTRRTRRRIRHAAASPRSRIAARYAHGPTSSPTIPTSMATCTGSGGDDVCSTSCRNASKITMSAQASSTTHPGRSRRRARPGGGAGRSRALLAEDAWRFTDRS